MLRPKPTSIVPLAALLALALAGASGCSDQDVFVHGVGFNDTLTNDLSRGAGLAPLPTYVRFGMGPTALVSDAFPVHPLFDTGQVPRATCYWQPLGDVVGLSWEVTVNGSVGTAIAAQDIASCTLSDPITRGPILDTDGNGYEITEDDWADFLDGHAVLASASVSLAQLHPGADDTCASLMCAGGACPSILVSGGPHPRSPLCMPEVQLSTVAGAGSTESERHGDATLTVSVSGSMDGTTMPSAARTAATTFKGVGNVRVIRRPLTREPGTNRWRWHTPYDDLAGPWEENFSPRIHLNGIRAVATPTGGGPEQTVPMRGAHWQQIGAAFWTDLCPPPPGNLTVADFNLVNCPNLVGFNPTQSLGDLHRLIEYRLHLPQTPPDSLLWIEFTLAHAPPGALTVEPGSFSYRDAYPGYYEELEEKLRAFNWTKETLRVDFRIDEKGWLRPGIPEGGLEIPPGSSVSVTIGIEPDGEGERTEMLSVVLTDARGEVVHEQGVPVVIQSSAPAYLVEPDDATGPVVVQSARPRTFTITNVGSSAVDVLYVVTTGSTELSVSALPRLPLRLAPGRATRFEVAHTPSSGAAAQGAVSVITAHDVRNILLVGAP